MRSRGDLLLARRLDSESTDTGSGIAALLKEYRLTMATAVEGANKELDPLQIIRVKMAQRAGCTDFLSPVVSACGQTNRPSASGRPISRLSSGGARFLPGFGLLAAQQVVAFGCATDRGTPGESEHGPAAGVVLLGVPRERCE